MISAVQVAHCRGEQHSTVFSRTFRKGETGLTAGQHPCAHFPKVRMQTLGIVGGIAPESTVEYYRSIVASYRARRPDGSYPRIIVNSIDMKEMLDYVAANDLGVLTDYLVGEVRKLARGGADVALFASNTPHIVFEGVQAQAPIPLISIVEATCAAVQTLGFARVGLFGTRFTMQGRFYSDVFSPRGITLVLPDPDEQLYIHDRYMGELVKGVFLPETRERIMNIVARLKNDAGVEGVILGGTELPLLLRDVPPCGIPLLDTTRIHVERAVAQMLLPDAD
jgi:aspartate racemase